ncbi:MAG TPA: DUF423 domain-containing protein [Steroidobacteraceae bacterium]|jgi:uncharacterized membrane protein YgdD (TMEM256/DUF423 family)|nr:DUF423 domain-containing protein [Steroidobacteraceae bacterium]
MSATARAILITAGLLLALGTVFGAVGTHALRARLTPDQLAIFETAVRYHFYNAIGLLGVGAVALTFHSALLRWSAALIVAGIVLFSGALYLASFGAPRIIHLFPPFGGLALIAGWVLFAIAVWRR